MILENYVSSEIPTGDIDGSNDEYTLLHTPVEGTVTVFLNGLLQDPGDDYTIAGSVITFAAPPETGDVVLACYYY